MLLELSITNFCSIKDEQNFNMYAKGNPSIYKPEHKSNYFTSKMENQVDGINLLKSSLMYGANASGKSTFINAFKRLKSIIKDSINEGAPLPYTPFKLSKDTLTKPTEFEIIFIVKGIRYQYGFSYIKEYIVDEWLYSFPKNRAQLLFTREWDKDKKEHTYVFGKGLTGQKNIWKETTRIDGLFLSVANRQNSKQIMEIYNWINNDLLIVDSKKTITSETSKYAKENGTQDITDFLQKADLGISDISIEEKIFDIEDPNNSLFKKLIKSLSEEKKFRDKIDSNLFKSFEVTTFRDDDSGKPVKFDLKREESDGTIKMFYYSGILLNAIKNNKTIIIDEIDLHLHNKLLESLFKFFNSKINNGSQLIATVHNTSILNLALFLPEQIWFSNKTDKNITEIYSLSNFKKTRTTKFNNNLEGRYLLGAFEAIPNLSGFDFYTESINES